MCIRDRSTTSLQVSAGDEIRVVARPNDYYLNKAILVDGKEVATSKEYKFCLLYTSDVYKRQP